MSFLKYCIDKRYFLLFYLSLMTFVTLNLVVSVTSKSDWENLVYIHIGGLLWTITYLVIGYFYRNKVFNGLIDATNMQTSFSVVLEPQTHQHAIFLSAFHSLEKQQQEEIEEIARERSEYQQYILSWVHEVKTPIAAGRVLLENHSNDCDSEMIDQLEMEIDKIDHFIEQALYYSRIDRFSQDYFISEVSLHEVSKSSVKRLSNTLIDKEIGFLLEGEDALVQSDSKWLCFIISQILSNAAKYSHRGGEIKVQVEADNNEKRLIVYDQGIGIKQEELHRVFEKGFTGTNGRIHTKSTGIGMYLADQMAGKLGHMMTIDSVVGAYTKVTIRFPHVSDYYKLNNHSGLD